MTFLKKLSVVIGAYKKTDEQESVFETSDKLFLLRKSL